MMSEQIVKTDMQNYLFFKLLLLSCISLCIQLLQYWLDTVHRCTHIQNPTKTVPVNENTFLHFPFLLLPYKDFKKWQYSLLWQKKKQPTSPIATTSPYYPSNCNENFKCSCCSVSLRITYKLHFLFSAFGQLQLHFFPCIFEWLCCIF